MALCAYSVYSSPFRQGNAWWVMQLLAIIIKTLLMQPVKSVKRDEFILCS